MGVSTIALTAAGSYTTFPSASITSVYGGLGTTLTVTAQVAAVGAPSTPGSGYTTAPAVTFSASGGSGAAATSTLSVSAINVTYGGGGYTAPTLTINDTGSGSGATATANVNAGTVMTAGTSPTKYLIDSSTPPEPASPINEIYNPSISPPADLLFYSYGTSTVGDVYSQPVTNGLISASPASYGVSGPGPGTGGIVVDNVSSAAQASSIYFGTLGEVVFSTNTPEAAIAGVTSPGAVGNNTATVTLQTAPTPPFTTGQSIVIAGVVCTAFGCPDYNGTWTITAVSSTKFTYTVCSFCLGGTATADTGTATGPTTNVSDYAAIKLTQSALQ
jgi:hypothetical protein